MGYDYTASSSTRADWRCVVSEIWEGLARPLGLSPAAHCWEFYMPWHITAIYPASSAPGTALHLYEGVLS